MTFTTCSLQRGMVHKQPLGSCSNPAMLDSNVHTYLLFKTKCHHGASKPSMRGSVGFWRFSPQSPICIQCTSLSGSLSTYVRNIGYFSTSHELGTWGTLGKTGLIWISILYLLTFYRGISILSCTNCLTSPGLVWISILYMGTYGMEYGMWNWVYTETEL